MKTLDYYNTQTEEFVKSTVAVDFAKTQDRFLAKLSPKAHILDFGCGSGRDAKYFLERGFQVTAVDGSVELCKFASVHTGLKVEQMYFQDLNAVDVYDGIWACASILHLPYGELADVLGKMVRAVKLGGVIYTSFKYGTFEGERNGRYFTDFDEAKFAKLLECVPELKIEELWIAGDVREGRSSEKWLNVVLRKEHLEK